MKRALALLLMGCTLAACGPNHIAPFTARERNYKAGEYAATQEQNKPTNGSIYSEAQSGYLEDTRALRVGDVVLVRINEKADAQGGATTNLSKETNRSAGIDSLLGLVPAIQKAYPNIDPKALLEMASSFDFAGSGKTQRAGTLNATIGVKVKQELPNGDLFVEGTKVVMINYEEQHLYISGVIRPPDIAPDNSVDSSLIADARVEFTGRGDIDDQVERGWLTKIIDAVNPFQVTTPSNTVKSSSLVVMLMALALVVFTPGTARADKVRDLVDIVGARENQLVGYGVVTGLNGTGDDVSSPFATQSLRALLRRLGVQVDARQIRLKNVAAVIVTANIPAFARNGSKLDIVVSSMGNAKSLRGGVFIQTPLRGANRLTYAVGQGPLVLGGFSASGGSGSSVQENITTTARIPNGALIEREIKTTFAVEGKVTLALRAPNFDTATRICEGLNKAMGEGTARPLDGGSIEVKAPSELKNKPVELVSKLGDIDVEPGSLARVVLNERTGTIVAGGDVRLSPVAIAQGGITISVKESKEVSQPGILSRGTTAEVKRTDIEASEQKPPALTYVSGAASLAEVAQALSTFGVTPRELGSILQALKAAGALRAEVIVQ